MMLAGALQKMIDSTECLFFLNTPNSITSGEATSITDSPWIYMEIMLAHYIRRIPLKRISSFQEKKIVTAKNKPKFEYPAELEQLIDINSMTLHKWLCEYNQLNNIPSSEKGLYALDLLYDIT